MMVGKSSRSCCQTLLPATMPPALLLLTATTASYCCCRSDNIFDSAACPSLPTSLSPPRTVKPTIPSDSDFKRRLSHSAHPCVFRGPSDAARLVYVHVLLILAG